MLNAIQQGILTRSTKERLDQLEELRDELEGKIACEKLTKPRISAEFMTFWLHRFRKLDVTKQEHRKMLIDTFVNAIFLYDDKLVITYNFKEGTTTITFAELQSALEAGAGGSDMDSFGAPHDPDVKASGFFCVSGASAEFSPAANGSQLFSRDPPAGSGYNEHVPGGNAQPGYIQNMGRYSNWKGSRL